MELPSASAEPEGSGATESADARQPDARQPDTRQPEGRARVVLRVVVTVHAVALFTQAVLAGRFLSGSYDMLILHADNANAIFVIGLVQALVTVVYWRRGRLPGWPAAASALLVAAETVQSVVGYTRSLGLHVPLGVAVVAAGLLLLVRVWRPMPANRNRPLLPAADAAPAADASPSADASPGAEENPAADTNPPAGGASPKPLLETP